MLNAISDDKSREALLQVQMAHSYSRRPGMGKENEACSREPHKRLFEICTCEALAPLYDRLLKRTASRELLTDRQ